MIDTEKLLDMTETDMELFAREGGVNEIRDVESQLQRLLDEVQAERRFREQQRD